MSPHKKSTQTYLEQQMEIFTYKDYLGTCMPLKIILQQTQ